MKKILGVVGSPRRNGNTHILVSTILHGAKEKGAETDIVLLGEMRIQECDGCHACWKARKCRKNDDMNVLYEKLAQSDVIVFGTPVYWYGPTALMKAFIDRFVYFNCSRNREKISGKGAVIAVPFEEKSIETASGVVDFFEKCFQYLEMKSVARIIVPGVTRRGEIRKRPDQIQSALEIGRSLV